MKEGKAAVLVTVGALREDLEQGERNPVRFDPVVLVQGSDSVRIQMNVSATILPSPAIPIGDIPEWDTQFFQGGLPNLGKRRP